ncbi:MAG: restriction endonuclease [Verrucomicrobiota bacterium]
MPVPDFQSMMLPVLQSLEDGKPRSMKDVRDFVALKMGLAESDREEKLQSGTSRFDNRIAWCRAHFVFARLVESPMRGEIQLTKRGKEVLREKPEKIDLRFLRQFPEYAESRDRKSPDSTNTNPETTETDTPEESLEKSFAELRTALAADLLEKIKSRSPKFFEDLVIEFLLKLGYGGSRLDAGEALGRSGDGGIDGVIKEDKLGLDLIYLQAKRWENPVGPAIVREFLGALDQHGAKKGVLITTSRFTKDALIPLSRSDKRISLIDGLTLAEMMIDHDLGVNTIKTFHLKKVDADYFDSQ